MELRNMLHTHRHIQNQTQILRNNHHPSSGSLWRYLTYLRSDLRGVLKVFLKNQIRDPVTYTKHAKCDQSTSITAAIVLAITSAQPCPVASPPASHHNSTPLSEPPSLCGLLPSYGREIPLVTASPSTPRSPTSFVGTKRSPWSWPLARPMQWLPSRSSPLPKPLPAGTASSGPPSTPKSHLHRCHRCPPPALYRRPLNQRHL
ncbi:uncharacterized protein LOC135712138 [Ochlerotatus camptorhynchus]|uniref:uncharacterized protein LOC135712138 n=1 Tax=Ochlerotatus camptorhynchus TaxID=644619 RepID=UPI0031D73889